jgi:hypothetical protein
MLIRNYTPIAWQAEVVEWIRDIAPHNKIDDLIDRSEEEPFDIVVNFKRAVRDEDIDYLNGLGQQGGVQMKLKYLSSVAVEGLSRDDLIAIADLADVAFIEQQAGFSSTLDVSVPSLCVTPAAGGCTNTVPGSIDGTGINIAIMDSGVDNAVHQAFPSGQYVAGYDATTAPGTLTDPDDDSDSGHGTHVASIALGNATANTSRGVAPNAGLIDIKKPGSCLTGWPGTIRALEAIYDNRNKWGVNIINMSFGQCTVVGTNKTAITSDGMDAFSQMVDLAESMGIVVVATAGNYGPNNTGMTSPGAATRAITVAASQTLNTVTRTDDNIADFSSRGPRGNDGDTDQIDELKPEVTAPGSDFPPEDETIDNDVVDDDINAWTHITAPVPAGANVTVNVNSSADIAAGDTINIWDLVTETSREIVTVATSAGPGGTSFTTTTTMSHPSNTGAWEIRQPGILAAEHNTTNQARRLPGTSMAAPHVAGLAALIMQDRPGINAASVKDLIIRTAELPSGTAASLPAIDPTWNDRWGWGLVNAYEAIDLKQETDLAFPSHPPSPHWLSPDISATQLTIGKPATITAKIRNNGPNPAINAKIHFGVHVFSASTTTFYDLGTKFVDIPVNPTGSTDVPINWTPKNVGHQCFKVEIGYGPDTDYSNNKAQRNMMVSHKTVTMFQVKNTLTVDPSLIRFITEWEDSDAGWDFLIDPSEVSLAADDPPADIEVQLFPPPDAEPNARQMLHIAAVIDSEYGPFTLGGVSIRAKAPCDSDLDQDGDVDGADLSIFAANPDEGDLTVFAAEFGGTDCMIPE